MANVKSPSARSSSSGVCVCCGETPKNNILNPGIHLSLAQIIMEILHFLWSLTLKISMEICTQYLCPILAPFHYAWGFVHTWLFIERVTLDNDTGFISLYLSKSKLQNWKALHGFCLDTKVDQKIKSCLKISSPFHSHCSSVLQWKAPDRTIFS